MLRFSFSEEAKYEIRITFVPNLSCDMSASFCKKESIKNICSFVWTKSINSVWLGGNRYPLMYIISMHFTYIQPCNCKWNHSFYSVIWLQTHLIYASSKNFLLLNINVNIRLEGEREHTLLQAPTFTFCLFFFFF